MKITSWILGSHECAQYAVMIPEIAHSTVCVWDDTIDAEWLCGSMAQKASFAIDSDDN